MAHAAARSPRRRALYGALAALALAAGPAEAQRVEWMSEPYLNHAPPPPPHSAAAPVHSAPAGNAHHSYARRVAPPRGLPVVGASPQVSQCSGSEQQWVSCQESRCDDCVPRNCTWEEWSQWQSLGGCTGLGTRQRRILQDNNECGEPCEGFREETVSRSEFLDADCQSHSADCIWEEWSQWSECGNCEECPTDRLAQAYRYRRVLQKARGDGEQCTGAWNETKPCGLMESPQDCKFTEWGMWTACSATCGTGWQSRLRRVREEAQYNGRPCNDALRMTRNCIETDCPDSGGAPHDCELTEWEGWTGCDSLSRYQMTRHRNIFEYAQGKGSKCEHSLSEIAPCPDGDQADQEWCSYTAWTSWSACPATCGGSQQERSRSLATDEDCKALERASLREVQGCGLKPCSDVAVCELTEWSEWGECSQLCGSGVATRERAIKDTGAAWEECSAALKQMKECSVTPCPSQDCKWSTWDSWGACTATCGGGSKRRSRTIDIPPREGGIPCAPQNKSEVEPCNTQACDLCVDGAWTSWGEWSGCTATCGPGYRWRHRGIARRQNHCGNPAVGAEDQYERCDGLPECPGDDEDCMLSEWSEWGGCSCSCFGVKERHRHVVQYAKGNGKQCLDDSLKEVSPCHPGPGEMTDAACLEKGPANCIVAEWEEWSLCSATCDGGQTYRERQVLAPSSHMGQPCDATLSEVMPCGTQRCDTGKVCVDCLWGDWSEWGACSGKCGGERYRQRSVERLPSECGTPCEAGAGKEVQPCVSTCGKTPAWCKWSTWMQLGDCSATCGTSTKLLQRRLELVTTKPDDDNDIFLEGYDDMTCSGTQTEEVRCDRPDCSDQCQPEDCTFSPWAEWQDCDCTQLAERARQVRQASRCGGRCEGALRETKVCIKEDCLEPVDCELSKWDHWSTCSEGDTQTHRHRVILQEGRRGGAPCHGTLEETQPCDRSGSNMADCELSDWGNWQGCSRTCGGGVQHRERSIKQWAVNGGSQCQDDLAELAPCHTEACPVPATPKDCQTSPWSEWTPCNSNNQQSRTRQVTQQPDQYGVPCNGTLSEIKSCDIRTDCEVTPWTDWDQCDKDCGGGQKQRQRQVIQNPLNGGLQCPPDLIETMGCNLMPCDSSVNCKVTAWSEWGECSTSCGPGYQVRNRDIADKLSACGAGCVGKLTESQSCEITSCNLCDDCVWGQWQAWSVCTRHCGGGQHYRVRNITRHPTPGCQPCEPKTMVYMEGCNTQECPDALLCVDGEWNDWLEWQPCSTSCMAGLTWRVRTVKVEANHCGQAPTGDSHEEATCNENVPCEQNQDCVWGMWSEWSDCSATCSGVKRRHRRIATPSVGDGAKCEGATEQSWPCAFDKHASLTDWGNPHLYMALTSSQNTPASTRRLAPIDDPVPSGNLDVASHARILSQATSANSVIRYPGVASDGVRQIDLLIISDDNGIASQDPTLNGLQGNFGNINIASGETARVRFTLVDSVTDEDVQVNDLVLKFFDLDEGLGEVGSDSMTWEIITTGNCHEYYTAPDSRMQVMGLCQPGDSMHPLKFTKPYVWDPSGGEDTSVPLDLTRVAHSNLGDMGPGDGDEGLRYSHVATIDSQPIDLLIKVADHFVYDTFDSSANGHLNNFGIINVRHNRPATVLNFNFVEAGTNTPVEVRNFNISFYDIDGPTTSMRDRVGAKGFTEYYFPSMVTQLTHEDYDGGAGTAFMSEAVNVADPLGPLQLTPEQQDVSVTFFYHSASSFQVTLEARHEGVDPDTSGTGENFFFALSMVPHQQPSLAAPLRRLSWFPWGGGPDPAPAPAPASDGDGATYIVNAPTPAAPVEPAPTPAAPAPPAPPGSFFPNAMAAPATVVTTPGCTGATKPAVTNVGPASLTPQQEARAVAVRFRAVSSVQMELTVNGGCGHNFLFAGKVCVSGDCDPCIGRESCIFEEWTPWTTCSAQCGGGAQNRTREIRMVPAGNNGGGDRCMGDLVKIKSCNTQKCAQDCVPQDCTWQDWEDWTSCNGKEWKQRFRRIAHVSSCFGRGCEKGDAEEIAACDSSSSQATFCAWGEWSAYSSCSTTCGAGRKSRHRALVASAVAPLSTQQAFAETDELLRNLQSLETQRVQGLVIAFVAGTLSLGVALMLAKAVSKALSSRGSRSAAEEAFYRGE